MRLINYLALVLVLALALVALIPAPVNADG